MFYGVTHSKDKNKASASVAFLNCLVKIRDAQLVLRFKAGDKEAFERVYRKFHKPILRFVVDRVRAPHLAEEVTQEVFLKAYRFRESYDSQYELSTWLWTIARNAVSDWFRKKGQALPMLDDSHPFAAALEELPSAEADPERALIQSADREVLLRLMNDLTELQRKALFMRLIHQLSYQEIARRLNLSLSAVKCLVHRAKGTLTGIAHWKKGKKPAQGSRGSRPDGAIGCDLVGVDLLRKGVLTAR